MPREDTAERIGFHPSTTPRLQGIEGLRAIAAGSIVLVHIWAFSSPEDEVLAAGSKLGDAISTLSVGVTLFFTLSAFLLYRPFAAAIARDGKPLSTRACSPPAMAERIVGGSARSRMRR